MPNSHLNILIESKIPFIKGLLEPYASVTYADPADITPEAVRDVDALIVRTRTRCDASLLEGSRCRFIATATIGTDHIDLDYCRRRGITVANAAGCNAPAVAQYVVASVMQLINRPVDSYTIGIVGVGHVGTIVERWCRSLGMEVLACDPPRADRGDSGEWHSLDELARRCDIITFHTPLTTDGPYATRHMAGEAFFASLRRAPIVINSARGSVVDTPALVEAIDRGLVGRAVIDCWEGEPRISPDLLERAAIATPHIAGYSRQGKLRATTMALDAICGHFGLPEVHPAAPRPADAPRAIKAAVAASSYSPMADTAMLRAASTPDGFESLRNNYTLRDEL